MIKDLNQIYDPSKVTNPDPAPDPKPKGPGPVRGVGRTFATVSPTNVQGYIDYMPEGVYDERNPRESLDALRGARQSFGEKLGRRAANLVPNIAANLVDMVGSVGALLTEWGDERDYSNQLTELADSMKDPFGKTYRHDNSTWALGDASWWLDNIFGVVEYAGAFALGGAGAGSLLGAGARGLSTVARMGTMSSKLLQGAAQLGTSALVSYAESAQAGAEVFNQTYNHQLQKLLAKGISVEEATEKAKHIAAQSAATTAQLGTLLTMGLNVGAYAPLFKTQSHAARDIIAKRMAMAENQSMANLGQVVRGLNASDYMDKLYHHSTIGGLLREMGGEGLEEVGQQFAQMTGEELGKSGQTKGFLDQFKEVEHLLDRTANAEGLLSFTLGAAFGGLQSGLLHNVIPSKHVEKLTPDGQPIQRTTPDGKPMVNAKGEPVFEKHWITPRAYERDFTQKSFNTVRDALAADLEHQGQRESELLQAMQKGDPIAVDEARDAIFAPTALHAVKQGMTEPFVRSFEKIAELDNVEVGEDGKTAAMRAGYADEPGTDDYKKAAKKAVADLRHLTDVYHGLQKTYGTRYQDQAGLEPFVDMVFAREADLHAMKGRIDNYEQKLEEARTAERAMAQVTDPAGYNEAVQKYLHDLTSAREVERQILADHKLLMGGDAKQVGRLLRKYRAIGMGDGVSKDALKVLDGKLRKKQEQLAQRVKDSEAALLNSTQYNEWLQDHPDASFNDYLKQANERMNLSVENRARASQLEMAKAQYDLAKQHLSEMTREKNAQRFMRKVTEWQEQARKEAERVERAKTQKLSEMVKDKATTDRLKTIDKHRIADTYKKELEQTLAKIQDNNERIAGWQRELETESRRDPLRARALRRLINQAKKDNLVLQQRAARYQSLYVDQKAAADAVPVPETISVEDVTGEDEEVEEDQDPNAPLEGSEEDIFNEITGGGEVAETEPSPATIQDELEAMTRDIEGASPVAESRTIEEEYQELVAKIKDKRLLKRITEITDGFISGKLAFSLDLLKPFVANKVIYQDGALQLLQTAKAYADEIRASLAPVPEEAPIADPGIADIEARRAEALNKDNWSPDSPGLWEAYYNTADDSIHSTRDDQLGRAATEEEIIKWLNGKYDAELVALSNTTIIVEVVPPGTPDTPVVTNADPSTAVVPAPSAYHAGYKIVEAATTGATSTIGYEEGTKKDKAGKTVYIKVTKPGDLLRPTSEEILKPGKLLPSTDLLYEIDVDYDGPKHITDSLSWDDNGDVVQTTEKGIDYLKDGKVKTDPRNVGNVPIRVKDAKTGKFLFHIRTLDWLEAKFPGTEDYRNVVDVIETEEGPIDNLDIQRQKLMEIRTAIVERFNKEGKPTEGKIAQEGKGTGRPILNYVIQSKDPKTMEIKAKVVNDFAYSKSRPESSLLPDESLELGIVMEAGVTPHTSLGTAQTKKIAFDTKGLVKGAVGAFIPSANGELLWAPLIGQRLADGDKISPALNSVTRAIELYLLNDGTNPDVAKEIAALESQTGFNVGLTKGLRGFINQYYTYLQGFQDAALSPNASTGIKAEQFLFNVDDAASLSDKTRQIKAGFAMRGDGAHYAKIKDGKLDPKFVGVLREGFQGRSQAVVFTDPRFGIKGLNSKGKFYSAVYNPGTGKWKHDEYASYNQYVKSFSRTPVYGRNQLADGTYVYTANPHLPIEVPDLRHNAVLVEEAKTATVVKPVQAPEYKAEANIFDDLFNESRRPVESVQAFGTGSELSQPLSLKTLQDLYNFTPEAERNGRTPMEMLEELTARGHSYISKGYNPFSRCL